jgi:hypothetical protein
MINKIALSEKNLTSNSGILMLHNHTDVEGIIDMINEEVTLHNPLINKIKMNHIKSLETISRFLKNFDYRTTHQSRVVSLKVFNHMLLRCGLLKNNSQY